MGASFDALGARSGVPRARTGLTVGAGGGRLKACSLPYLRPPCLFQARHNPSSVRTAFFGLLIVDASLSPGHVRYGSCLSPTPASVGVLTYSRQNSCQPHDHHRLVRLDEQDTRSGIAILLFFRTSPRAARPHWVRLLCPGQTPDSPPQQGRRCAVSLAGETPTAACPADPGRPPRGRRTHVVTR